MSYNFRPVNIFGLMIPGLFDVFRVGLRYAYAQFRPLEKLILAYYYTVAFVIIMRLFYYIRKHPDAFDFKN